jgi:hypothetical protein
MMASMFGKKGRFRGPRGAGQEQGRRQGSLGSTVLIGVLRAHGLRLLGRGAVRMLLIGLLVGDERGGLFGEAGLSGEQGGKGQGSGSDKVFHGAILLRTLRGFEVILVRLLSPKKRDPGE